MTTPHTTSGRSAEALPASWQRLLALSGIAFAVLFLAGFLISGSDAPDYAAADQEWRSWAADSELRSRFGALLILLASFVFLPFASSMRSVMGSTEAKVRGFMQLARVVFAGGLIGVTGITMAVIITQT